MKGEPVVLTGKSADRAQEILDRRLGIYLDSSECEWLLGLLTQQIKSLRGSGRGTRGAQWARELRVLLRKRLAEYAEHFSEVEGRA